MTESQLNTISDYIHDSVANDHLINILITSAAEGAIKADGHQTGQGKSSLAGALGQTIFEKYNSFGELEAFELVKENFGYNWGHYKECILRGYKKRQLFYCSDDFHQIAGKHLSHDKGIKWIAYSHTTKRPQLAVFVATAPHIGSLAKCWRDVFDWEIKCPVRGYYEVQQIKTKTIYKDPLNPLKLLMYKGEADFPKPSPEFEEWYKNWRDIYNEEEFIRGWGEYFSKKEKKNEEPREYTEIQNAGKLLAEQRWQSKT